jgi:hypothetical protein
MSKYFGQSQLPGDTPGIEGEPTQYYTEAKIYEETSTGVTIDLNMYNIVTSPPQYEEGLSFKYFLDLSEYVEEGINISKFTTDIYYSPAKAEISGLKPWDEDENIYYVEVTFPDEGLYVRTYLQFAINFYENKLWDSSNDFSTKEITDTYSKIENIPIYKNGVLVFGKDPSGNEAVEPTPLPSDYVSGDLNGDGLIDSRDCVLLSRYLLEIITEFSYENALQAGDVDGNGVINTVDYAYVSRYVLDIISEFPKRK